MGSSEEREQQEYDRVTQASLNGIYVKAQELDRGHNAEAVPHMHPPGAVAAYADGDIDVQSHASTHASERGADIETHASTHASDR